MPRAALPFLALLAACQREPEAAPAIEPAEGHWSLSVIETTEDTCGIADSLPPSAGYTLAWAAADTAETGEAGQPFTLDPDDTDATWTCAFQDPGFSCALTRTEGGSAGGASYTLTYAWAMEGSFSSDTEAAGTHALTLACDDSDDAFCADIAERQGIAFPCGLSFTVALSADAP